MDAAAAGSRLDRYLAARLDVPRSQIQRWIEEGRVVVDGTRARRAADRVAAGAEVACDPPPPAPAEIAAEAGPLTLLHEDAELLVIDKPPGIAVHPGAGREGGTLAHRLLAHYPELSGVGGPGRPGIVHRLDKDTSGVLLVARTPLAYRRLSRAFAERRVDKRYLAIVHGVPRQPQGTIAAAVGRHPTRRRQMTVRADGRPARTSYRVLATAGGAALLEIDLETGRTHQIRVHAKHLGHPLVGDPVYGEARWRVAPAAARRALRAFPRPALHAWRLGLAHPASAERLEVEAPVPADLRALWQELGGSWGA
ncbi:MAG TPA: RluA family pseudouridine synthase [Thermoanaerobaculia bacterium]|nr:RluA family pseudouridine synthase [Thermoanaerobaculia bacterium]